MPAHGLMFHHFHDDFHPKVQGSISAQDLVDMIHYVGRQNILSADEWMKRSLTGELNENDLCLTFDDALRCQFDVALPVLQSMNIKAFWFVYSSIFKGNVEPLEVYRYFRTAMYEDIDEFYEEFFKAVQSSCNNGGEDILSKFDNETYLLGYSFFSKNDRIFRWLRDDVLEAVQYQSIMESMMVEKNFDGHSVAELLWMNDDNLRTLRDEGHIVGLHSHTHPTRMMACTYEEQEKEYQENYDHLSLVLGSGPVCMSHPCNSYNDDTISILQELGIKIGFRADMDPILNRSSLELYRQDCANLMEAMRT